MVDRLIHEVASHQRGFNSDVELLDTVIAGSAFKEIDGFQGVSLGIGLVFVELVVGEHHALGATHLNTTFASDVLNQNIFVLIGIQPLTNRSAFLAAFLHELVLTFFTVDEENMVTLCVSVDYDSLFLVVIV